MNVPKIQQMLLQEEGEVLHAYRDQLGYWTIGVGRLIDGERGGGISHEEAMYLLAHDIEVKALAAKAYPWFAGLDENRQAVVVGMIFQLGAPGFDGFHEMIAELAAGNYITASEKGLDSKWAKQTPDRAGRMMQIIRTGEWPYGDAA